MQHGSSSDQHPDSRDAAVRRTVLPGGLRVLTETVPTVRSAAFGVWVGTGSRDETPELGGATHYLEHLLFKGTTRRSALDISAALEAVGGDLNAFTDKEYTCYYARVLDSELPLAVDVISDMITSALNRAEDVESERGVILEEIAMTEDEPSDLVQDLLAEAAFGDSPLGRPVLGTTDTVNELTREQVDAHYRQHYRPGNLVVAVAGNLDHDTVVQLVAQAFEMVLSGPGADPAAQPEPPRGPQAEQPAFHPGLAVLERPSEQAHVMLGLPGTGRADERRWALAVLNSVLGDGMSSRLFQEIRENRGLAYSVSSQTIDFAETGLFGIYAGCQPERVPEVLKICREELARLTQELVPAEELQRAIGQICGSTVLGLEDTGALMVRLGRDELCHGSRMSVDELLGHIRAVTAEQVRTVARELLSGRPALALIGPFPKQRAESLAELLG